VHSASLHSHHHALLHSSNRTHSLHFIPLRSIPVVHLCHCFSEKNYTTQQKTRHPYRNNNIVIFPILILCHFKKYDIFASLMCDNSKDMEATVANEPLNSTQLRLLKLFSRIKNEEEMNEIDNILMDFYRKKADKTTEEFWNRNNLTAPDMEKIMYGHD